MSTQELEQQRMQQQVSNDYRRFAAHLPPELQTKLETLLTTNESKAALFEGLMFAIQFGRKLQECDDSNSKPLILVDDGKQPSELFMKLMQGMKQ